MDGEIYDAIYWLIGEFDFHAATDDERADVFEYVVERVMESDGEIDTTMAIAAAVDILYPEQFNAIVSRRGLPTPFSDNPWIPVKDGDGRARVLYERHYSSQRNMKRRRARRTKLFVGPGEKLVLITPRADALFVWRRERYINGYQMGINCAVFRNEGAMLSSQLILYAEEFARRYWTTATRLFTYVDPQHVRSTNPGYTFLKAGWQKVGSTEKGLLVFEKRIVPSAVWEVWLNTNF
ncbi:MAG: hypothetical protein IAE79_05775 [Anaerolinea sp.]|nr:hypothetical protein [Anaerolinea sp.]